MADWVTRTTSTFFILIAPALFLAAMQRVPAPSFATEAARSQASEPVPDDDVAMGEDVALHREPQQPPEITDPNAEALPIRHIASSEIVSWTTDDVERPIRLRADGVTLTIRTVASPEGGNIVHAEVLVEAEKLAPVTFRGPNDRIGGEQMIGIGRLDRDGTRFVYYQGYTGGAHCCRVPIVAVIGARSIRAIELGSWDGGPRAIFPRDVNGDGAVDFVERDERFRYAFGGGAVSYGPPQILNIETPGYAAQLVDVSWNPSFRPLFMARMREARHGCVTAPVPDAVNADCALYAAAAARAGRFSQAWREVLRAPTHAGELDLPAACRFILRERETCPTEAQIVFTSYPDALRHFLRETGYIAL